MHNHRYLMHCALCLCTSGFVIYTLLIISKPLIKAYSRPGWRQALKYCFCVAVQLVKVFFCLMAICSLTNYLKLKKNHYSKKIPTWSYHINPFTPSMYILFS